MGGQKIGGEGCLEWPAIKNRRYDANTEGRPQPRARRGEVIQMANKLPLFSVLFSRGIGRSASAAQELILAGGIKLNRVVVTDPFKMMVGDEGMEIEICWGIALDYVDKSTWMKLHL